MALCKPLNLLGGPLFSKEISNSKALSSAWHIGMGQQVKFLAFNLPGNDFKPLNHLKDTFQWGSQWQSCPDHLITHVCTGVFELTNLTLSGKQLLGLGSQWQYWKDSRVNWFLILELANMTVNDRRKASWDILHLLVGFLSASPQVLRC